MGQAQAVKEAIWLLTLLKEPLQEYPNEDDIKATIIYGDNQGVIATSKNLQFRARMKHIDIHHYFVRGRVADRTIDMPYIPTTSKLLTN